jgi:multidrug resistance efflux pump
MIGADFIWLWYIYGIALLLWTWWYMYTVSILTGQAVTSSYMIVYDIEGKITSFWLADNRGLFFFIKRAQLLAYAGFIFLKKFAI